MGHSYVPARFANSVALHVLRNLLAIDAELIFGVQGPPGEGKTFQCYSILERLGVAVVTISGSEFESRDAGHPAQLLVTRYKYASRMVLSGHAEAAVLFVNDIDAGIGNFGDLVQYTVNTQQINAALMAICDYPQRVGDEDTVRVPLIVTANDLGKLYGPLTRPGRMVMFTWRPKFAEKVAVVAAMYSDIGVELDAVRKLVREYRKKPIAFFHAVKNRIVDERLHSLLRTNGFQNVIAAVKAGADAITVTGKIEPGELSSFARDLAASQRARNFLEID